MRQWPYKAIGEVCDVNPKQNGAERLAPNTTVSFVPMSAVDETFGEIIGTETRRLEDIGSGYTPFCENDVLFAKITPCMENGKTAIARHLENGVGYGSTEFHVLRSKKYVMPEWVFAFVRQPAFREQAKASFTGTAGQQRVPADFFKQTLLPVPPMQEQERIVRILDEADQLRRLRAETDRRTAELIPALFHEMFGDASTNPRNFRWFKIGDLTELVTSGLTPLGGAENYTTDGPYFFRSQNVQMNRIDFEDIACLPLNIHESMSRTKVREGDVLLNITGASIGRVAWVEKLEREANVNQHVCIIRPKQDVVLPPYLSVFLSTPYGQEVINQTQAGASRQGLNHEQVRSITVMVPPVSEQHVFAARIAEIRTMEDEQASSRQHLNDLFQSLLHRAFQGEL